MSRSTISTFQLFERFPDQEAARIYLEGRQGSMIGVGRAAAQCGSGGMRRSVSYAAVVRRRVTLPRKALSFFDPKITLTSGL
jgi:hypothetical protein